MPAFTTIRSTVALTGDAAIVAADPGANSVASPFSRLEPEGDGEGHLPLLQRAQVGREIHPNHLRREGAVGRHHFDLGACRRCNPRRLQGGMVASLVVNEHVQTRLDVARADIPRVKTLLRKVRCFSL